MAGIEELFGEQIWVVFTAGRDEQGRMRKTPIDKDGRKVGASHRFSARWMTHNQALDACKKYEGVGVGFRVPKNMVFVDLDHTTPTAPLASSILERFDTYVEASVSGEGLHLYGYVDTNHLPLDEKGRVAGAKQKNSKLGLEMYLGACTSRFAIYTGNALNDAPLADCTDAVLATARRELSGNPTTAYATGATPNADLSATDVVDLLRHQANAEKFTRLYDKADTTAYGSASEADLALCSLIAFRTHDPELIDEVFRASALYRDKWEREDYRRNTIAMALKRAPLEFQAETTIDTGTGTRAGFVRINAHGLPAVFAPALARHIRRQVDYLLVRDSGRDAMHLYVYDRGVYTYYATEMLHGLIKAHIATVDEDLITMRVVREVAALIMSDTTYIPREALDADEDIINFTNGYYHLPTGQLLPHTPEAYSTIQLPIDYPAQQAPTPVFDDFLATLTSGDEGMAQVLLEYIGACLSNIKGHRFKKALFMVGPGNTGKSQLKSLIERLLGKGNFIGIDLKDIEARFGTSALYQKRLAGSSDMSFLSVDELKTFKKLTGGDSVFAEFKGEPGFEYTYTGLLWFCMNQLPRFSGDDGTWVYERIMVAPCHTIIPAADQDRHLIDKLWNERAGITTKALTALKSLIARDYRFNEPAVMAEANAAYRIENNTVAAFNAECLTHLDTPAPQRLSATGLYDTYKAWCADNNNGYAKTARQFRTTLAALYGSTHKTMTIHTKNGTCYTHLALTDEAKTAYAPLIGLAA